MNVEIEMRDGAKKDVKNTGGLKIALVFVSVIAILACGFITYTLLNQKSADDSQSDSASVEYSITSGGTDPANIPRTEKGKAQSYIDDDKLPNARDFLATPPSDDSETKALDLRIATNVSNNLYGSDRWALAAFDAEIDNEKAFVCHWNCQIGVNITPETMPFVTALILRAGGTAARVSGQAKEALMRDRPFVQGQKASYAEHSGETCRPDMESSHVKSSSYPSSHSAEGYLTGLILASLDPEDSTKILERARQYSESRVICNYHWYSDIAAGREIAAATFTALSTNPQYLADFTAAKLEFEKAKSEAQNQKQSQEQAQNQADPKTIKKDYTIEANSAATPEERAELSAINDIILNKDCDWENQVLNQDISSVFAR